MFAAEFTKGGFGHPATLDINTISGGHRTRVIAFSVTGKREAREIAKRYGAKCWNF